MKTLFFVLFMTASAPLYAAQICLNFPDGEQTAIVNGLTEDGTLCNQGEAVNACAKRKIIEQVKFKVKTWTQMKNQKAAIDALTPVSEPGIS